MLFHGKFIFQPITFLICCFESTNNHKLTLSNTVKVKVKVKVILRPKRSRPVCLGVRHPSGTRDQFVSLFNVIFLQLRICWCGAPSLTRGRVCSFLFLLGLTIGILLGSGSRGTHDHILLPQYWDSSKLEGQVPVFIPPWHRVVQLYPQALGLSNLLTY
jgi:hypothetical protein